MTDTEAIESVLRNGYSIWIMRMKRVPYGVVIRSGLRYTIAPIIAYGAGETIAAAIDRAMEKITQRLAQRRGAAQP